MKKMESKKWILATLFCVAGSSGVVIAKPFDVGVIGPKGEVLLYFREGNMIVVKNCPANTVLGSTPREARANCPGNENKVPVETFKQAIRSMISVDRVSQLAPLTSGDVNAYKSSKLSEQQISAMQSEYNKIVAFIKAYGDANADLPRRDELQKTLSDNSQQSAAIKKVNTEIEKTISLITDQQALTITKANTDKNAFLYTILKNFSPTQKYACGNQGTVAQRIQDCSYSPQAKKSGWSLVTRTAEFKEVWQDSNTGLVWGDRLPNTMNYDDAQKACNGSASENGKLRLAFRVPTIDEYKQAEKNGIRSALPNIGYWYWSSSVYSEYTRGAWLFSGDYGYTNYDFRDYDYSVRCVAGGR